MQKISSLQAFVLRAPDGGRPHWVSNAIVSRASELLLCLRTSEGMEGFGLATCSRGVAQVVEALRQGVADEILSANPLAPERLNEKLIALTSQRLAHEKGWGREALIRIAAAADIACWDIIGKIAGLPLYQLFGGYRDSVPCYVTCAYYRDGKDLSELRDEMQKLKAQGHRGFKAKAGGVPLADDIKRIELVREVMGNDRALM